MNWDPRRDAIPTFVNDEGAANVTNDDNDDDLLDVAKNPHSSIKSVFFPPNFSDSVALPYDSGKSKRHQRRVSTDVETLLKIDNELSPLRFQYSEIIGKARALGLDGSGFDLDISRRLNRPDTFGQSVLSPSASNYFSDRNLTYLRRAAISSGIENRSALVDKTSPSSTFSVVGKPTPRGSRTSWLNENGSSCRQEALSFAIRDPSRTLENFDGPRSFSRVRNSVSYFPTTNSHTSRGENVLNDRSRNGCVSNSNFQSYRKSKTVMERATSAFVDRFAHETINADPLKFFNKTEYNSHLYLNKTTEDSRISIDNSFGIQRLKSSVSTHIVIDNNWPAMDKGTANKRPNEHFEIPSGNQNSTEFASRSGDHKSTSPEIERVVKDDRIFSPLDLKSIDPDVINSNHGILRTGSASTCVPQIRVVSVNTEFRTTVEKRYTNRAISPIRHPRSTTVSPTLTSLSNVLLATKVSSILVQQVRADSSRKMAKIEPPTKMCSIDARCVRKRNVFVDATSKRDFCAQKVDSRLAAENPSRLTEFKNDEANLTTKFRKAQCVCLPRTKETITIVPIVLTDGTSGSPRTANVDVAVPRRAVKTVPKVSYQPARFDARKFRGTSSLSIRDNEGYRRAITNSLCLGTETEQLMDERGWRADRTSVSRGNRHLCAEEDYSPSTTTNVAENPKRPIRVTTSKARGVRKTREDRESGRPEVARTLPGMRSTPEDFLCET
ncbi:uncharacterized protein LOC120359682 [Solenopsis invicta]|uniref:uncharacterized protein LOC120359682 n=1 Tax=Solenopsis invicta TaxID=13686 RepID=UPI0001FEA468|nr:uncharacterized protein LOC120359682 [Solenopsis invicta]